MCQSKANGGRRCAAHQAQTAATALIPRRGSLRGYYTATDHKHFDTSAPGSTFTDPTLRRLNDVVALAHRQRGHLDGDDRDQLIALGAPDEAFKPGIRYLLVRTPGTVGVIHSTGLPDTTQVRVTRTKPGAPCSLVVDTDNAPTTDVGTIVLGPASDTDRSEVVYTAHPGLPTPADLADPFAAHEGQTITLAEVRAVYGDRWLNARVTA